MLILSRKQEESVVIGNDIILKVISIDKGNVKLGFEAPPKTLILRAELTEAIKSENTKATGNVSQDVLSALGMRLKNKRSREINAKDVFKQEQAKKQ
ncbi:carbon storage regulator [Helicobacter aurati]|uniref:Translational regulator CsrA n=1 Tax=Helicobacter aurati TaxID=137778 RepID=A0A3D8J6P3_9HELI|nr:carbon storage regulator [Helicobacter aurati]RDU73092.1 carbon storage regulator [Helicobacter aurati]